MTAVGVMVSFDGEREATSPRKRPWGNKGNSENTHSRGYFFPALSHKSVNLLLTLHFTPNRSQSNTNGVFPDHWRNFFKFLIFN